jgi:hypothetical protein
MAEPNPTPGPRARDCQPGETPGDHGDDLTPLSDRDELRQEVRRLRQQLEGAASRELADMMLGTLDAIWTGAMDGNVPDPAALKERIDWYTARLGGSSTLIERCERLDRALTQRNIDCNRLTEANEDLLRDALERVAELEDARRQLRGAVEDRDAAVRLLNDAQTTIIDTDLRREWEAERARLRALVAASLGPAANYWVAAEALQAIAADPQIGGTGHPVDVLARNALETLGLLPTVQRGPDTGDEFMFDYERAPRGGEPAC